MAPLSSWVENFVSLVSAMKVLNDYRISWKKFSKSCAISAFLNFPKSETTKNIKYGVATEGKNQSTKNKQTQMLT